jgi:branched-chain amino acid transport system substrate-binding protein
MRPIFFSAVLALLAGCSFTTAAGLEECKVSSDCSSDQVCTQGFCLPQPAGCDRVRGSEDASAIPLGALIPLSTGAGTIDESDQQALNAVELALDEANQRDVKGRKLALYICDTAGDLERTRRQAAWLVNDKRVAGVVTAGSSQTLEAAKETLPKGVLTISYSATSPELTSLQDTGGGAVGLVWRTSPSDAIQGRVISNLLLNDARFAGITKVGILYVNDPYGQGLFNVISEQLSGKRTTSSRFYERRGEVAAAVTALNGFDPDITVLVGFEDDARRIIQQAATEPNLSRASGHRWLFTDSVKDVTLLQDSTARAQVDGSYGTAPAQGAGQAYNAFSSRFLTKYNKNPADYSFISHAYDAMYLMVLGAAYSQGTTNAVTGAKMAEGLTKLSTGTSSTNTQLTSTNFTFLLGEMSAGRPLNVEGASGRLDFDDKGEASSPIELWRVEGTTFQHVQDIEP